MRKHKKKIITGAVIAIVLAFVFWYGGDAPGLRGWMSRSEDTAVSIPSENSIAEEPETEKNVNDTSVKEAEKIPANTENKNEQYSEAGGMEINPDTGKDEYQTEPVSDEKPAPIEPEDAVISDKELTCILSVRCDTILKNIGRLDKEKVGLVPGDGVIFAEKTVTFYEGESVFNLLVREMKRNKIHMEFENTPIYNSAYIEGIANLYEFDCGELSGWMYKVNDWFPNYGCSRYQLKSGDKVEWVYTCDLGADVGGNYSTRNGR